MELWQSLSLHLELVDSGLGFRRPRLCRLRTHQRRCELERESTTFRRVSSRRTSSCRVSFRRVSFRRVSLRRTSLRCVRCVRVRFSRPRGALRRRPRPRSLCLTRRLVEPSCLLLDDGLFPRELCIPLPQLHEWGKERRGETHLEHISMNLEHISMNARAMREWWESGGRV